MKTIHPRRAPSRSGPMIIKRMIESLRIVPLLSMACGGLTACATSPDAAEADRQIAAALPREEAQRLAEQGRYAQAAQRYEALADAAPDEDKAGFLLQASQWHLQAAQPSQAQALLQNIRALPLSATQDQQRQLIQAQVLTQQGQTQEALTQLDALPADLPADLQAFRFAILAQIHDQRGETLASLQALIQRAALLSDVDARRANDQWIWNMLQQQSAHLEQLMQQAPDDDDLQGWLSLAAINLMRQRDPQRFASQWQDWQTRFPDHPAGRFVQAASSAPVTMDHTVAAFERIAVLLPFSGRYGGAADAVRDGLLAAYYEHRGQPDAVRQIDFYDSGDAAQNVVAVYEQALREGAQAVVGPLSKDAITTLIASGQIKTPIIVLNQAQAGVTTPSALYQFTLAPEDEARQVAERAILDGHHQALALVPQGDWGARILAAFTARYQELGGKVIAQAAYADPATTYDVTIKQLLKTTAPDQRADMLFMAAFPPQGRLLRPLLNFNAAADLPIYATSHIYDGKVDPQADQDLEGIVFPGMPWLVHPQDFPATRQLAQIWPMRFPEQAPLFALGHDAFELLTLIRNPAALQAYHPGATGQLHLAPNHVIEHHLVWSRFEQGRLIDVSNPPQAQTQPLAQQSSH